MQYIEIPNKLNEVVTTKREKLKYLNIRIDKTVPPGITVGKRICNENCVFIKKLGIACHDDNSYQGVGKAILNLDILRIIKKIHMASLMPINIHIAGDGEPTLYESSLIDLISSLRKLDFINKIKITTNGTRLLNGQPKLIERLKTAGIDEINVSLHSLDQKEFQNITGINSLTTVLEGIKYAVSHGVKTNINCLIREKTADELDSYITLSRELKIRVKFFGLIDETGINQKYLDNLLDNFRCLLDKKIGDRHDYTEPYYGIVFNIRGAIIDLKDSRINNCPVLDCKVRNKCIEGCRYYARLSPTGILQPCGVRTDNLLNMKEDMISNRIILEKLIDGGKILINKFDEAIQ